MIRSLLSFISASLFVLLSFGTARADAVSYLAVGLELPLLLISLLCFMICLTMKFYLNIKYPDNVSRQSEGNEQECEANKGFSSLNEKIKTGMLLTRYIFYFALFVTALSILEIGASYNRDRSPRGLFNKSEPKTVKPNLENLRH